MSEKNIKEADVNQINFGEHKLSVNFDTGANQADGSVIVSMGDTTVLATATLNTEVIEADFVPLRIDYLERHYAAHAILGSSYERREGKPTTEATLSARAIDRALRPHLPKTLRNELHLVITVLSLGEQDPSSLGIIAGSLAISNSGLTWSGPVAATRINLTNPEALILNPTFKERQNNSVNQTTNEIIVSGTADLISMVEFSGAELGEEAMSQAGILALEVNKSLLTNLESVSVNTEISDKVSNINKSLGANDAEVDSDYAAKLATGWRSDGRSASEIRDLTMMVNHLPGLHGSARFSRGKTTVLATATLDTFDKALRQAGIEDLAENRNSLSFITHYNFPPYAVGNAGRISSPNRRELGHGNLVAKSLLPLLPEPAKYPYTTRLVAEVLASDGSSSMASVCAGSLALLGAGIPINGLVAGIAVGLAGSNDDPVLLVDIDAEEDQNGLMDFKIAGTKDGITVMQLDVKHTGITLKVFNAALQAGQSARHKIIDAMEKSINGQTFSHPENAPLIVEVPRGHIGRIIGKGGANIREIEQTSGAQVSIERDQFAVIHGDSEAKSAVLSLIEAETREYHVGEDFQATVREFLPYGAIVELDAGREALLHVSELQDAYVEKTEDLLKVGQEVPVTIVETSSDGRIKVSVREKYPEFFADKS